MKNSLADVNNYLFPSNHKPVGSERIDSKDGYVLIKVAEPRTWKHS